MVCGDCVFAKFPQKGFGECYEQSGSKFMASWVAPKSKACLKFRHK